MKNTRVWIGIHDSYTIPAVAVSISCDARTSVTCHVTQSESVFLHRDLPVLQTGITPSFRTPSPATTRSKVAICAPSLKESDTSPVCEHTRGSMRLLLNLRALSRWLLASSSLEAFSFSSASEPRVFILPIRSKDQSCLNHVSDEH